MNMALNGTLVHVFNVDFRNQYAQRRLKMYEKWKFIAAWDVKEGFFPVEGRHCRTIKCEIKCVLPGRCRFKILDAIKIGCKYLYKAIRS